MRQLQYAKPKMWIKAGMLLKMMLKSLLKSLKKKKKIKIKSDALTFFCEKKKKRVFTVIIYRTPYPLRIISK